MKIGLTSMITESRNPASADIDNLPTLDMLGQIKREDQDRGPAVGKKHCRTVAAGGGCGGTGIPHRRTADLYGRGHLRPSRDTGCQ